MKNKYYVTTTLPYVNSEPHIGFALEIVRADALARFASLQGSEVIFNTGTDEHGLKIHRKALEQGITEQEYVDGLATKFKELKELLNLSYTNFIRTTDEHHKKAAQEFWKICDANGDIYKKTYKIKYCVGCELEKTDSELVDDKCPIHPTYEIELIDEENYFFKFSNFQEKILKLYEEQKDFVIPDYRQNEIKAFVERDLQDFSISRLKEKMPWGVEVPGDSTQVMYVWFDALVNYISTLGWPEDEENFKNFWPGVQVAGKDNLRQQSAMWQAMLMSANLPNSKQVFIGGFITSDGQKMSKSIGNVISPLEVVEKYGTDAVRYFLLGGLSAYGDGDWSKERFEDFYTAHLVNGVGNLTSRILTMIEKYSENKIPVFTPDIFEIAKFWENYESAFAKFDFEEVIKNINSLVSKVDVKISEEKPWEKVKTGGDISVLLYQLVEVLRHLALSLVPIISETANKILSQLNLEIPTNLDEVKKWGILKEGNEIKKAKILFARLEK